MATTTPGPRTAGDDPAKKDVRSDHVAGLAPPPPTAPFAEKLAYYKTQHTSRGVRGTHLVGVPTVVSSLPLAFARPRVGLPLFITGWAIQLAGHKFFEHNRTSLREGPLTYQLTGVAFWCEEVGDMLAAASRRRSRFPGRSPEDAAQRR